MLGIMVVGLIAGCGRSSPVATPTPSPTPVPTVGPVLLVPPDASEMEIENVRSNPSDGTGLVLLKEKAGDRFLLMGIGPAETAAIAIKLEEIRVRRPLTHDLLNSTITRLGGHVSHVIINDFVDDVFYAKIIMTRGGRDLVEVDSRPSDAMALALRAGVPVYADKSVLDEAGFFMEEGPVNGESQRRGE